MENYSVLMTVYEKENPVFFEQSINGMLCQTVPPDDFVLVCDGPLNPALEEVLRRALARRPGLFQVVRLPQNVGAGAAGAAGLARCRNDLVARMDADDLSRPERCARELAVFEDDPGLSIVGGWLSEFRDSPQNAVAVRRVPLENADILHFARRRMPFNNPTVIYRKSAALRAGGYAPLRRCEDYDLYARMLAAGCRARNLGEVLLDYRLSPDAYKRRGMLENLKGFIRVRWRIYRSGFSSLADFLLPCMAQVVLSLLLNPLRNVFYEKLLRK